MDSRNGCVARVTEIPARIVLHERPFDIPTCCLSNSDKCNPLTDSIQLRERSVAIILFSAVLRVTGKDVAKESREKIKASRYYYHSTITRSISGRLTSKSLANLYGFDYNFSVSRGEEGSTRERRGRKNTADKKEKGGERGEGKQEKWEAGIETKGGEDREFATGVTLLPRRCHVQTHAGCFKGIYMHRTSLSYSMPRNGIQRRR